MIKKIIVSLSLRLIEWAFSRLFNAIDTDKNGELSQAEIDLWAKDLAKKLSSLKYKLKRK